MSVREGEGPHLPPAYKFSAKNKNGFPEHHRQTKTARTATTSANSLRGAILTHDHSKGPPNMDQDTLMLLTSLAYKLASALTAWGTLYAALWYADKRRHSQFSKYVKGGSHEAVATYLGLRLIALSVLVGLCLS